MNNKEVRTAIFESNLKKYEIAEKLGVTAFTLSHWLQTELDSEKKTLVLNAIQELKKLKK